MSSSNVWHCSCTLFQHFQWAQCLRPTTRTFMPSSRRSSITIITWNDDNLELHILFFFSFLKEFFKLFFFFTNFFAMQVSYIFVPWHVPLLYCIWCCPELPFLSVHEVNIEDVHNHIEGTTHTKEIIDSEKMEDGCNPSRSVLSIKSLLFLQNMSLPFFLCWSWIDVDLVLWELLLEIQCLDCFLLFLLLFSQLKGVQKGLAGETPSMPEKKNISH